MELALRGLKSFRGVFSGCRNNKMLMDSPPPHTHALVLVICDLSLTYSLHGAESFLRS